MLAVWDFGAEAVWRLSFLLTIKIDTKTMTVEKVGTYTAVESPLSFVVS